jgi:nucleotide-binding universal stress UspA family protein
MTSRDSTRRRRAYEPGHRPKFMAVVDATAECDRAVRFAARRASRTASGVVLLAIVPPMEAPEWLGVGEAMQAEAEAEAQRRLERAAATVRGVAGLAPDLLVRRGEESAEILRLIDEDEDIAILVLAAGIGSDGPGPLVTALAGRHAGNFPVPIAIVPGHLQDEEIDALA